MWCCAFSNYICDVKIVWLSCLSCFRHSDKNDYGFPKIIHHILVGAHQICYFQTKVLSIFSFTNCYGFMLIFFLNLGCYYNAVDCVEYRHKYLNRQHISKRKTFLVHSIYDGVARRSSISNIKFESVSSAGQAITLLCEELSKVFAFSAHKIFTTFCAPFPNRISHFKILAMP